MEQSASEIRLELSLNRASGVLAGIVASLSRTGLELQTQKMDRDRGPAKGWLEIICRGQVPDIELLADNMNNTRGVERLMRVEIDGQVVLAEGQPLPDQMQSEDLFQLTAEAGQEPQVADAAKPDRAAASIPEPDEHHDVFGLTASPDEPPAGEAADDVRPGRVNAGRIDAAVTDSGDAQPDDEPDPSSGTVEADSEADAALARALTAIQPEQRPAVSATTSDSSISDPDADSDPAGAMRRRRRRRR
ncbi:MAG: hypothetical protein RQ741_04680 [Wenzhouxiangellaceae bacterium]|nr:hypothetical protein [Wenzhouxiangellaceae bacterium]